MRNFFAAVKQWGCSKAFAATGFYKECKMNEACTAEDLAQERFKRTWAPSRFSTFGDGVVTNYPVETFYPKLSKEDGYAYVAREAEKSFLKKG